MSFFAQLLTGGLAGAAGGYIKDREEEEKLAEKLELRRLQQEQALQLQAQRQQDRIDMFNLSQAAKGGGSGGSRGNNGADVSNGDYNHLARVDQALSSGDPAQIEQAIKMIELGGGPRASAYARQVLTGKAPDRQPTSKDVLASMATDGKEYTPQPPSGGTLGQREALQGLIDFQRAYARGVGKAKDQSEAESQEMSNDIYTDVYGRTLREGKSPIEAGRNAAKATNPVEFDKNQTNADRVAATTENIDLKRELAALKAESDAVLKGQRSANEIEDLIAKNRRMIKEFGDKDGTLAATVTRLERRLTDMAPTEPAPKTTISSNKRTSSGKISTRDAAQAAIAEFGR